MTDNVRALIFDIQSDLHGALADIIKKRSPTQEQLVAALSAVTTTEAARLTLTTTDKGEE